MFVPTQIAREEVVQIVLVVRESYADRRQEVSKPATPLLRETDTSLSPARQVTFLKEEPQLDDVNTRRHPESRQPTSERVYDSAVVIDEGSVQVQQHTAQVHR